MNKNNILFSFCIATKDRHKSLLKRLSEIISTMDLLNEKAEIIVVDSSMEELNKSDFSFSKDINLNYIFQNLSLYDAYQKTIEESKGIIIKMLSDDDEIIPHQMAIFLKECNQILSGKFVCINPSDIYSPQGKYLRNNFNKYLSSRKQIKKIEKNYLYKFSQAISYIGSFTFSKSILENKNLDLSYRSEYFPHIDLLFPKGLEYIYSSERVTTKILAGEMSWRKKYSFIWLLDYPKVIHKRCNIIQHDIFNPKILIFLRGMNVINFKNYCFMLKEYSKFFNSKFFIIKGIFFIPIFFMPKEIVRFLLLNIFRFFISKESLFYLKQANLTQ